MNKPKVVLKCVKFHTGHDTMTGFNADVWINGIKCFHAYDSANGGCYEYQNYDYNNPRKDLIRTNIKSLEDYIKTLEPKEVEFGNKKHTLEYDMDLFIEELLEAYENEKHKKKMLKLQQTSILVGVPNANSYSYISYKNALKLLPKLWLQTRLDAIVKKHCTGDIVILNTNLEELGLTV